MKTLSRVDLDARDVYRACISRVRSDELKARLEEITGLIVESANNYHVAGLGGALESIAPHDWVGDVSSTELIAVYEGRMVPSDSPGRQYYDRLITAPPQGICPSCNQRRVSTLDHYLPKTFYPSLAVAPDNLVPACKDCNTTKSTKGSEQFIHPYYDAVDRGRWLFATVAEDNPPAVLFHVLPPSDWDVSLRNRLVHHFEQLAINELYTTQAAVELTRHRARLKKLFALGGAMAVRSHLEEEAETSEEVNVNSWSSAGFRALASSDWYCGGGFNLDGG